jgi:hypothetical protein
MSRALVILALAFVVVSAHAQALPTLEARPLVPVDGSLCPTPFTSACPPPPGDPVCAVREHAESRDGRVRAEIVEDGRPADLVAVHLAIHVDGHAFVLREIGHRGVGCGTDDLYAARFDVRQLRVADVLGNRAPEVVLRAAHADGDVLYVCATDGVPRCVSNRIASTVRFARPDVIVLAGDRMRVVF